VYVLMILNRSKCRYRLFKLRFEMQIIDRKNKDYYDYIAHQYRDKTTTYDRRGSVVVDENYLVRFIDNPKDSPYDARYSLPKEIIFFLEIGNVQYLISIFNLEYAEFRVTKSNKDWKYLSDNKIVFFEIKLLNKYDEYKHYLPAPLSISYVWRKYPNYRHCDIVKRLNKFDLNPDFKQFKILNNEKISENSFINNPILKNTKIPSIIEPLEIYKNLEGYFSGFNRDKTIEIQMSDKEKIVSKGFDPVSSFRNI